jgi:hypothetical protein
MSDLGLGATMALEMKIARPRTSMRIGEETILD